MNFRSQLFYLFISGVTVTVAPPAMAQSSDVCAEYCDYLCRHYRSDIKPVEIRRSTRNAGDFMIDSLALRLENVGTTDITFNTTRPLQVWVEGLGSLTVSVQGPFDAGQSKWVPLGAIGRDEFPACTSIEVDIDAGMTFGQWGCSVHNNDRQELIVRSGPWQLCPRRRIPIIDGR